MNKFLTITVVFLAIFQIEAQEWETPIIEGYGKIKYVEDAEVQPDKILQYNLVFDLKYGKEKEGVNTGLFKIARTLNMLGVAGVPAKNINIVAAIHGDATFIVLNEEKYQEKYGKSNPNLELMKLLQDRGVKLFVCSQATASRNIDDEHMNPYVQSALSALSVLSNYQLKGYIFMP